MRRGWRVGFLVLSACGPPPDALVSRCTRSPLSIATQCALSAVRLGRARSAYLDPGASIATVHVSATLSVARGLVLVSLPGCAAGGEARAAPAAAASLECDAKIDRGHGKLELRATPVGGEAEGFACVLEFKPV